MLELTRQHIPQEYQFDRLAIYNNNDILAQIKLQLQPFVVTPIKTWGKFCNLFNLMYPIKLYAIIRKNIYYRILIVPATQDPTIIVLFDITQKEEFQRQNTLTYQM